MAIDLSGLFVAEVQVRVQGSGILIATQKQECIEESLALPKPISAHRINNALVVIHPLGTDVIALAERLASTWESRGYKVERIVTPLGTLDSREVQSFILA